MQAIYNGITFVDIDDQIDLPTDFETDRIPNKGDIMCFTNNENVYYHCEVLYIYDQRSGYNKSIDDMEISNVSIYVITKKIDPELGNKTWKSINDIINKK